MKPIDPVQSKIQLLFFCILLLFPLWGMSQQSFKVVCDKEAHQVKVVPAQNRSSKLVPLKGGFASTQAAEAWIEKNYQDRTCDPERAAQKNQAAAEQNNTPSNSTPVNTNTSVTVSPPARAAVIKNRNTAIIFGITSSNMDEALSMDKQSTTGWQLGIEYVVGQQFYGGSGFYFQMMAGAFEEIPDFGFVGQANDPEPFKIMNFKIPLYLGRRSAPDKDFQTRVDVGVVWNNNYFASNSNTTVQGHTFKDSNFAFILKGGIGGKSVFVNFFIEKGMTDAFENINDFSIDLFGAGLGIRL